MSHPYEPKHDYIRFLAGYEKDNYKPDIASMGVLSKYLPQWDDIQIVPAQLAPRKPLLDILNDEGNVLTPAHKRVGTDLKIGSNSSALQLDIPLIVSDMSFGSLSDAAKIILAKGAELAGTATCSGEGGILKSEAVENNRFMVQIGTAKFGYNKFHEHREYIKAIHFKGGQAAKTGTGGLLPSEKLTKEIREARGLPENYDEDVHSPSTYRDKETVNDFKNWIKEIRNEVVKKDIPIGYKISANHIETDIQFALDIGVDYIIIDGRGGATGAAPTIFRDHISVPTIPALARARHYLDKQGYFKNGPVKLIATGGIRVPSDFIKALALGADAIALSNSVIQAIGCRATRQCFNNSCQAGIATQEPSLVDELSDIEDEAVNALKNFFNNSVKLMTTLAAACGHTHLNQLSTNDLTTFNREITYMAGVPYGGLSYR